MYKFDRPPDLPYLSEEERRALQSPSIFAVLWTMLYLPAFIFPRYAGWKVDQPGVDLNLRLLLVSAILLALAWSPVRDSLLNFRVERLPTTLIQAYARSGEEYFTRGFIFLFALRIFRNQKWPALWAKKHGKSPASPNEGSS